MCLPPEEMLEKITQIVFPGCRLLRAWALSGGISAQMTAMEVGLPGGERSKMILRCPAKETLRRNPRAAEDEFRMLQAVQALGIGAPAPLHLERESSLLGTAGLVIEYIDAALDFCPADTIAYVHQMAERLAKIHSANVEMMDLSFLPQVTRCIEYADQAITPGVLVDQTPKLATRNAPALLHGDFWPGNLLWHNGCLAAVIDWEDACLGDPLYDLAITRLDVLCIFGETAMLALTTHYQELTDIDFSALPYWDLCAARRLTRLAGDDLVGWAGFYHSFGRTDITAETIHAHLEFFTAQALEKQSTE